VLEAAFYYVYGQYGTTDVLPTFLNSKMRLQQLFAVWMMDIK
jgi:hypothetical protein